MNYLISTYLFRLLQTSLSPLLVVAYLKHLRLFTILQEPPDLLVGLLVPILQARFNHLLLGLGVLSRALRLGEHLLSILVHELFEHIELLLSALLLLSDTQIGLDHWSRLLLRLLPLFLMLYVSLLFAFIYIQIWLILFLLFNWALASFAER
jgi:hypothetical protein